MDRTVEYVIRRLRGGDDLDDVVALEAQSFANPWSRDMLARELRNSEVARVYVLRRPDGHLLAFCGCWFVYEELHINTLAVQVEERRRGLATTLLRFVFAEATAAGLSRATLEVRRSNEAALRLYERLGFEVQAIRPNYYSQPVEDALILWSRKLSFLDSDPEP
jgi:[ribosomal protein S18]-alanine N-acetyltransferase